MKIAHVICTRQRLVQLEAALAAMTKLKIPDDIEHLVIVVENDETEASKPIVEKFNNSLQVHYCLEKTRGISPARNRGIVEALQHQVQWIGTCDDDGEIDPKCLVSYLDAAIQFPKCKAFIGRTRYIYPPQTPTWFPKTDESYRTTGSKPLVSSTANSFFKSDLVNDEGPKFRFDDAFKFSGGEDSDFFSRISRAAGPVLWVEEAIVSEYVVDERIKLSTRFRRQLRNGQNMARIIMKREGSLKAFLIILHKVYQLVIWGLLEEIRGVFTLAISKDAGLKRVMAGAIDLTSAMGMLRAYFAKPMNWYHKTDGY